MKISGRAIGITLFCAQLCLAMPARAADKSQVKFFCAPNQSNKMLPTTYAATSGSKEYLPLVTWRSTTKKITNQQRCERATQRFQAAWDKGSFDQLMAGKDQNGAGIICALSYRENKCDRSNSLFTLSKASDAQDVIDQIHEKLGGRLGSAPIYQSADRQTIEFKKLILKAFKKNN